MPAISSTAEAALATARDIGVSLTPRGLWKDPRALARGWTPPTLPSRGEVLSDLETRAFSVLTPGARAAVSISGPCGSGTSSIGEWLVATAKDRLTRPGVKGVPLVLRIDTSAHRSQGALVTALFREIDPAFEGRGSSTEFLGLLFLRRLRTLARPTVLLFDQIGAKADLQRVLGPLVQPDRTLPEGTVGLPAMLIVTAGASDGVPEGVEALRTALPPLLGHDLRQAIMTRANLAFNAPPSLEAVEAIASLSISRGWGLSMVGELLAEAGRRAEARRGRWLEVEDVALPATLPRAGRDASSFEAVLLEVLRTAKGTVAVGNLRYQLDAACSDKGIRTPTQTRLWRHLVGLERMGILRRELRRGGRGGTSCLVSLAATPEAPHQAPAEARPGRGTRT